MKQNKKGRTLLLLMLAVVLVFTGYVIISAVNRANEPQEGEGGQTPGTPQDTTLSVVALDSAKVQKLEYRYLYTKESAFEKVDGNWESLDYPGLPVNQQTLSSMVSVIAGVTSNRMLEEADMAEYGFDEPNFEITLTMEEGDTHTFFIGDFNTVTNQYYFNVKDSADIYMVSYDVAAGFMSEPLTLAVIDTLPTMEVTSMQALTYRDGEQTLIARYFANGRDAAYSPMLRWFYHKGDVFMPAADLKVKDLLEGFAAQKFSACVDFDPSPQALEEYGLSSPRSVTVEYGADGEAVTLLLGKTEGNNTYTMIEGSKMVCRIGSTAKVANIPGYFEEMDSTWVCAVDLASLRTLTITEGDAVYEISVRQKEGSYQLHGEEIERLKFETLYNSIGGLSWLERYEAELSAAPQVTVDFSTVRPGFEQMQLELFSFEGGYYARFLGNQYIIGQEQYDAIVSAIAALA